MSSFPVSIPAVSPTCYIISSKEDAAKAFPGETIVSCAIPDPSYNPTFKSIMSTDAEGGKNDMLISFLSSVYFPESAGDDDVMIRSIEENCVSGETTRVDSPMCDVVCLC